MRLLHMQPRDGAPGATHQVEGLSGGLAQYRGFGGRALDQLVDRLSVVAELGETQRAERQADPGADRRSRAGIDPH